MARELERLGVYWMEEPLHRADRQAMRSLRQATSVRLAAGEMTRQLHEFRDLIADGMRRRAATGRGARQAASRACGASRSWRRNTDVAFTPHTWTNGMGVTANAHLAAGLADSPYLEYPFDPPEWGLERRDFMLREPLRADSEGWINLGDAPGMGFEIDENALRASRLA